MKQHLSLKTITALVIGLITGALTVTTVMGTYSDDGHTHSHDDTEESFHVHAGFLVIVDDKKVDLTDDKYMSVKGSVLSENVHLHDNKDEIIHFHAPGITLKTFLDSIGVPVTNDCFTFESTQYCSGEADILRLYVNGTDRTSELTTYTPLDNDRILLYYGTPDNPKIESYLNQVSDRACIYTGTCPERGTAPAEECGLTCEL